MKKWLAECTDPFRPKGILEFACLPWPYKAPWRMKERIAMRMRVSGKMKSPWWRSAEPAHILLLVPALMPLERPLATLIAFHVAI